MMGARFPAAGCQVIVAVLLLGTQSMASERARATSG